MVPGARSLQSDGKSFDFNSERGIRAMLKAIRQADLDIDIRNELRDLVFVYTNGRGDTAVRNILEERFSLYQIVPSDDLDINSQAPVSMPDSGFSIGRPVPVFGKVISKPKPTSISTPTTPAPAQATATTPDDTVTTTKITPNIETTVPAETVSPIPKVTVPPPVPQPDLTTSNSTAPTIIKPTIPTTKGTTSEPKATETKIPDPTTELPSNLTDSYLERIRIIKADVNSRVGNPVNLVDIDNNLGREYMTALLEVIKLLNGGSTETVKKAMQRLEIVYEQVKLLIETRPSQNPSPAIETNKTPYSGKNDSVPAGAKIEPISNFIEPVEVKTPTPVEPAPHVPVQVPTVSVPEIKPVVNQSVATTSTPLVNSAKLNLDKTEVLENIPTKPNLTQNPITPDQYQANSLENSPVNTKIRIVPPTKPGQSNDETSIPITSTRFAVSTPVSQATPLRSIEELPTAASLKTSATGNPLLTKEVDNGLQQLLEEWSLFKKSGLFGTGPKGREHPLFLKIANLQIPLLLSGRFEGSTQEIKQSITDYMNGWRYEQGIIYEQGETFEQYLRRVIHHIINWQNRQPSP